MEKKQYIGSKIVKAWPCYRVPVAGGRYEYCELDEVVPSMVIGAPEAGYRVQYEDGYLSWSPKDTFEAAYRETTGLSFGLAIEAVKKGKKVSRSGWNGKGMFLCLADGIDFHTPADLTVCGSLEGDLVKPSIVMKTADDTFVVGWLASQTDMLADDWQIVE